MKRKIKVKFDKSNKGVTIWVNGRWVLDASLFKENFEILIDTKRMKKKGIEPDNHQVYKLDKRT